MTDKIKDSEGNIAKVIAGYFTGINGLRVFVGPTDPISDMPVFILAEHHHMHEPPRLPMAQASIFGWSLVI